MTDLIDVTVCAEASNCPRIAELPGGDFAVTGTVPGGDGTEATVIVPGAVMTAALEQTLAGRDEWHRQNGLLRGELEKLRGEREQLVKRVTDDGDHSWALAMERDAAMRRAEQAEGALMLLLIREGGRTEFTPKEMTSAPSDGSFVSSRDVATGNEVLEFVAAGLGSPERGRPRSA